MNTSKRKKTRPYRVFRPTYRAADGSTRETSIYHVTFKDHREIRQRVIAFSDKGMSDELGRKIIKLVAAVGAGERSGRVHSEHRQRAGPDRPAAGVRDDVSVGTA